ncbi:MAG: o-succinylbenzoate synthase [Actinobacteria bacterium]|nr:o-succinylbenzoate synthase [Actinomycetota bacterium]
MNDPALRRVLAAAVPFAVRLRRNFRGVDVREGLLIKGPSGWGEFAPFDDYSHQAAARWLDCSLEAAFGSWPVSRRSAVHVNAIVPAVSPSVAALLTRQAINDHGCSTIKVKVGGALADDEARVASVRDALDTTLGRGFGRIRIDANGAWDVSTAKTSLRRLAEYGLEYVEQPCREVEQIIEVRGSCPVPIAVDETLRTSDDAEALARQGDLISRMADFAIVKPAPLGGIEACLRVIEALPVPVVVSSSLDTSVGLAVAVNLAGILGLEIACGLGTGALFEEDLVSSPEPPVDGMLTVRRVAPDLTALLKARDHVSDERAMWWRQRLTAAWFAGSEQRWTEIIGASA